MTYRKKYNLSFLTVMLLVAGALVFQGVKPDYVPTKKDSMAMRILNSGITPTPTPHPATVENKELLALTENMQKEIEVIRNENNRMTSIVSRGNERKTSPILDYNRLSAPRYLVELLERMCSKHGFESIREIYSIVWYESKFDPTAHATKGEDSRGLLQVNVADPHHKKRHPRKDKLFDPAYNLEYQLDELKIYYDKGKKQGLSGVELATYISRYGQRPNWKTAGDYIVQAIKKYDKEYLNAVVKETN